MPKLTLSADEQVIEDAKRIAAEQGTSVSAMFERFIRMIADHRRKPIRPGPIARRVTGLAKLPRGKSARRILEDALLEKHGLDK
jgi:hypothetical protein